MPAEPASERLQQKSCPKGTLLIDKRSDIDAIKQESSPQATPLKTVSRQP
jgi:hypothetical protein